MNTPSQILTYLTHYPVYTLGPGKRLGIWLQGCSLHCKGCMSQDTWDFDPKRAVDINALAEWVGDLFSSSRADASPLDGLTVSGGEPFDQAEALLKLLRLVRSQSVRDILIFSGYNVRDLTARYPEITELATALVDGPFELDHPTEAVWKGSGNQNLTLFHPHRTPEQTQRYLSWKAVTKGKLQLLNDGRQAFIIGIPRQEDVQNIIKVGCRQHER